MTRRNSTDFLRLSRASIDDSITQNLNALLTPSSAGFDPSSTSQRLRRPPHHRQIDPRACRSFRDEVLFPSWQARAEVLRYCAAVATSPDPDDPGLAAREAALARDRARVVDERLDPYSARSSAASGEARTAVLASVVRQEEGVENIIRARTWSLVRERCGGETDEDWRVALDGWRKGRE